MAGNRPEKPQADRQTRENAGGVAFTHPAPAWGEAGIHIE
jgi:hypothetical protein